MSHGIDSFRGWLIDYYVASALLIAIAAGLMQFVRQPAKRVAIGWATVAGLFVLAILCARPIMPQMSLASAPMACGPLKSEAASQFPSTAPMNNEMAQPTTWRDESCEASDVQPATSWFSSIQIDPGSCVVYLFLIGSGITVTWLILGALLTGYLRWSSRPAPDPIQCELARLSNGTCPTAAVLLNHRVGQAIALGVVSPRIVLPERFLGQESCEAVDAAIVHESAHIRNGDLRMLACLRLLMSILFAHPLYWWLRSRMRFDQELLADAAAGEKSDVADYAEILLAWFRTSDSSRSLPTTATLGMWEGTRLLKKRITILLNDQFRVQQRAPTAWRVTVGSFLAITALTLSAVTLQPVTTAVADVPSSVAAEEPRTKPAVSEDNSPATRNDPRNGHAKDKKASESRSHKKYQNAEEAWRVGIRHYNANDFDASRKPLEAAFELANDDRFRIKVCEALKPSYRILSKPNKMIDACDFIIRHSDSEPKRSLTCRELLSFLYHRGKIDVLIKKYEGVLEKTPEDRTALFVLSETFSRVKRDPKRAAEMMERLRAVDGKDGEADVRTSANLAMQYVRQNRYRDAAELYERIAPLDKNLATWHWKEAANAWLKLGDKSSALAAVEKAVESGVENRSQLLTHFWHRHVGEVFLATGEPKRAVGHIEQAIENTAIEGYVRDCERLLASAKKLAKVD